MILRMDSHGRLTSADWIFLLLISGKWFLIVFISHESMGNVRYCQVYFFFYLIRFPPNTILIRESMIANTRAVMNPSS